MSDIEIQQIEIYSFIILIVLAALVVMVQGNPESSGFATLRTHTSCVFIPPQIVANKNVSNE